VRNQLVKKDKYPKSFTIEAKAYKGEKQEYNSKYYIEISICNPAGKSFQHFNGDTEIAGFLKIKINDYYFKMAKMCHAEKNPEEELYWDSEEDAQYAIDWIHSKIIMDTLTK